MDTIYSITPNKLFLFSNTAPLLCILFILQSSPSYIQIHVHNRRCCSEKALQLFLKVNLSLFRDSSRWGTPGCPQLPHRARPPLLCLLCQGRSRPCSSRASRALRVFFLGVHALSQARHTCFLTVSCGIITSLDLAIHNHPLVVLTADVFQYFYKI